MTDELETIANFIVSTKPSESGVEMNDNLYLAIGYSQRVGALLNDAEYNYSVNREKHLLKLEGMDDETETTRRAKLDAWSASDKKLVQDLKNMKTSLRSLQMSLLQSNKTLREERQTTGRGF